jgi:predicted DNA-binding transcriptional regulator AlpA
LLRELDSYDRPMPTRWSCPDPDCPPTEIKPEGVTDAGRRISNDPDRLLSTDDVSKWLGISVATFYKWRKVGVAPPERRVGMQVVYRKSEVLKWLPEQGAGLAVCSSECGRAYPRSEFKPIDG